jgi:multiphosphoryl transfer protein
MEINLKSICLDCKAVSKNEAIQEVGWLLVENGNILPDYIESMHGREKVANTYLGNGIAIPHGLQDDRDFIKQTGIAVVQIKEGVEWNTGERVHLIFGIAAKTDEHIEILGNLTDLVSEPDVVEKLSITENAQDIADCLTGKYRNDSSTSVNSNSIKGFDKYIDVAVQEKTGMHARPASVFIELVRKFDAEIRVRRVDDDDVVKVDSMASLLKLKLKCGDVMRIMAAGYDAPAALKSLENAVLNGLVEEDEEEIPLGREHNWSPESVEFTFNGIAASNGIAVAPVKVYKKQEVKFEKNAYSPEIEIKKIENAIKEAQADLKKLADDIEKRAGRGKSVIFKAHSEFLNDPEIVEYTKKMISEGSSAAWSWNNAVNKKVEEIESLNDELLSARAVDIKDIGNRVLTIIIPGYGKNKIICEDKVILIADDLTPSDTVELDSDKILGICTAKGGALSHTAIIARSLGIPAVAGAGDEILKIKDGETGILDGYSGKLYINPGQSDLVKVEEVKKALSEVENMEYSERFKPAVTLDGDRVEVAANIGSPKEAADAVEAGGEGVGLLRTEFLFLDRNAPPTEDEQYNAYSEMIKSLNGLPLTIRTLDIGGDKIIPYMKFQEEANPFLGVRGIRLCFEKEELFITQLRAIIRAAEHGPVRVMFPMISLIDDIKNARKILNDVKEELNGADVEIGMMVEVPSAAIMADEFAEYVDFFSIGTNDLTQYVLAMDRGNSSLAKQADGLNPAVLRMIQLTVKAAHSKGKWVGVCGSLAGDMKAAVILTGLGVDELSVSIPSIASLKMKLRKIKMSYAENLAEKALKCKTSQEVRALIK